MDYTASTWKTIKNIGDQNWNCFRAMSFAINGYVSSGNFLWDASIPATQMWKSFDQAALANGTIKLKRGDAIHLSNSDLGIEHGVVVTKDDNSTSITAVSVWSANMPNFDERTIQEYLADHYVCDPKDVVITIFKNPKSQ